MGALMMLLFPHQEEPEETVRDINDVLRKMREADPRRKALGLATGFNRGHYALAYPVAYEGRFLGVKADSLLGCIQQGDWRKPVLVVYRSSTEDTWSFVTMGISTPERLREAQ